MNEMKFLFLLICLDKTVINRNFSLKTFQIYFCWNTVYIKNNFISSTCLQEYGNPHAIEFVHAFVCRKNFHAL